MIPSSFGSYRPATQAAEFAHVPAAHIKSLIDGILNISANDNNSHYHECTKMMFFRIKELAPNKKKIDLMLSEEAENKYDGCCEFSFELQGNTISLLSAIKTSDIPWNSSDVFELAYNSLAKHSESNIVINKFEVVGISSFEDKSLATNLESVRKKQNSSIVDIEHELFIRNGFGRSILRMLNRVNHRPKPDSLTWSNSEINSEESFGRSEEIKSTETNLKFDIVII